MNYITRSIQNNLTATSLFNNINFNEVKDHGIPKSVKKMRILFNPVLKIRADSLNLESARKSMSETVKNFVKRACLGQHPDVLILRSAPGVGKTKSVIKALCRYVA